MKKAGNLINAIQAKVMKLGELQQKTDLRIKDQEIEIVQLKKQVENQLNEIKLLEEKVKIIKLAKITETNEGVADAKIKINEIVREIDKCIGLLNV